MPDANPEPADVFRVSLLPRPSQGKPHIGGIPLERGQPRAKYKLCATDKVVDKFIPDALFCKVSDQVHLFGAWDPYMNTTYLLQNEPDREMSVEDRDYIGSGLYVEQIYESFLDHIRQDVRESGMRG